MKQVMQAGDIVRVYKWGNSTEGFVNSGGWTAHSFVVESNVGGVVTVIDNWSATGTIVRHNFQDIANAMATGPNQTFQSAFISRINDSWVASNSGVYGQLAGSGFGDFSGLTGGSSQPEISVTWGGNNIADNAGSVSTANGTDFGVVTQGTTVDRAFVVSNSGPGTLNTSGLVLPTGFTLIEGLSANISSGQFDTFTVRLNTAGVGFYGGDVRFTTNDSDENPYNFAIYGNVTGVTNQAPSIFGPTSISRSTGQTISFTSLLSASDPDGSVAYYYFSDATPGTDNGYLTLDGNRATAPITVSVADLYRVGYYTGTIAGSNPIAIYSIDNLNLASSQLTTTIDVTAAVVPGSVSIGDVSITEGNSGTSILTFTATRAGGTGAFTVNYATSDGSATSGSDYVAAASVLTFGVGVNTQTVSITINGDTAVESNETLFVNLSGATNGASISDSVGQGTINNDDTVVAVPGSVSIDNFSVAEGNSGTKVVSFFVTRTGGTAACSVSWSTADGTATAGSDYVAASGTVNFAAGVNVQLVSITINGDTTFEAAETMFVNLFSPSAGLTITDAQGSGLIDNDDASLFTSGNDVVTLTVANGTWRALAGADTVTGSGGTDTIHGDAGDDTLNGAGGEDVLIGGSGHDTLNGGDGGDTIDYSSDAANGGGAAVGVYLTSFIAVDGFGNYDTITNVERIVGTNVNNAGYNDIILANDSVNSINAGAGGDIVVAFGGDDVVVGGLGTDAIYGGDGNDTLIGSDFASAFNGEIDFLIGEAGNDTLYAGIVGNAYIDGGAGNDLIYGGSALDYVLSGRGNDTVTLGVGVDLVILYATELAAGETDTYMDFTDGYDFIYANASLASSTVFGNSSGYAYMAVTVAGGTHYTYFAGVTAAQVQDQVFFNL